MSTTARSNGVLVTLPTPLGRGRASAARKAVYDGELERFGEQLLEIASLRALMKRATTWTAILRISTGCSRTPSCGAGSSTGST
jgi:hypothetical protein